MNEQAQALVFFQTLFNATDTIELRPIDPSGDADVARGKFWPSSFENAVELAFDHSVQTWNAYYGVFPRSASGSDVIAAMTCAWTEVDWTKLVPGGEQAVKDGSRSLENLLAEGRERSDATLAELPVPTLMVASGAGYHVYWMLAERLVLDSDAARVRGEALLRATTARAGGDKSAHDLARVLRVPGTVNYPNKRKRALRRGPVPTALIHVKADALYALEELEAAFAASNVPVEKDTGTNGTNHVASVASSLAPTAVESDYVTLHGNGKLLAIWNGGAFEGDRSKRDARFCLAALRDGLPEPVVERLLASMPGSKASVSRRSYMESVLRWARTEAAREPVGVDVPVISAPSNGTALAPVPEPWDPPIPLDQRREVEAFPADVLPGVFRDYAMALASYTATPVDMAAGLVLVAIAASVLGKFTVAGRWIEPTNIYFAAVAAPGERKSPVFRLVFRPIRDFERDQRARRAPAIQQERSLRRALEKRRERIEKEIGEAEAREEREDAERRLGELLQELAQHPEPVDPRLLVDDATPEVLARMLAEQKRGVALLSTEGGCFAQMSGRYAKRGGANLDTYNKAYDSDPITVDRVGGGVLRAERPHLVIGLTVQPALVRDLSRERALRDLGLLGRFLFSWPRSLVGYRDDGPVLPHELEQCYANALNALLTLDQDTDPLVLAPAASEAFDGYRAEVERDLRPAGKGADMADWMTKLCGKVLRLAALLHLASHDSTCGSVPSTIDAAALENAVRLGRYYTSHARAAFALLGTDTSMDTAEAVIAKIRATGLGTIKRSDLYELAPGRVKNKEDVDSALALLIDRRVLRAVEAPGSSSRGRPATAYDVNPGIYTREKGGNG